MDFVFRNVSVSKGLVSIVKSLRKSLMEREKKIDLASLQFCT